MSEPDVQMKPADGSSIEDSTTKPADGSSIEDSTSKPADGSSIEDSTSNGKESEPVTDLDAKIIRQVEYYFGNINLGRDHFLQTLMKEDDGWIPLETLLTFNRLKQLCDDSKIIAAALRKSTSGLVCVSDLKVRRNPEKPLPPHNNDRKEELKQRSVYVKGFPTDLTIDDLLKFFDEHDSPEGIQMRRDVERKFKGSCFVVFKTKEHAAKFLATETVKYNDDLLTCLTKDAYFKKKQDEKKTSVLQEAKKREEEKEKLIEESRKEMADNIVKGAILHLTGLCATTTREEIKQFFSDNEVVWVDFETGDSEAWVRFNKENEADKAWKSSLTDDKLVIDGSEILASVLEGESETKHWENIIKQKANRMLQMNSYKRNSRGGRKRGGGGGRGGGGRGGPPRKKRRN